MKKLDKQWQKKLHMTSLILDTNTIIRFLIKDIPSQFEIASKIFDKIESKKCRGIISILVINETIWALEKYYERPINETIDIILKILSLKNITTLEIDKKEVTQVLATVIKLKIDFTDAYLLWVSSKENYEISTFDKRILQNV